MTTIQQNWQLVWEKTLVIKHVSISPSLSKQHTLLIVSKTGNSTNIIINFIEKYVSLFFQYLTYVFLDIGFYICREIQMA